MNVACVRILRLSLAALLFVGAAGLIFAADAPPRLLAREMDEARFPPVLIAQGITTGEVWVIVSIDQDGRVEDALISRATHRSLGDEALRLLRTGRFEPTFVEGKPTPVLRELHMQFEATGTLISLDPITAATQRTRAFASPEFQDLVVSANDLDTLPQPTRQVSPAHPGRIANVPMSEPVVLEFIVDESGRPRLPALIQAPHPLYADRAAEALLQWQFTPPLRRGKPVAVRVRQAFVFPDS